ncbi:molybdate ABC transporter substrate-binding protein [Microbacterium sp. 3J1]|uniref:molybdate ABC transporter substrate-binding protein n=1 Tax=Microbacterium sp. 3J1 TaxID=861269 RepID=UPI000AFD5856|nr:molybdate ABC transporter substrate-binding protein [Microbacterium sp. 3J1]
MDRILRRTFVTVAAVTLAALALGGCVSPAPSAPGSTADSDTGGEIVVYAAASLADAFDEIGEAFTAAHPGAAFTSVYDGSSTLVAQLAEGAPADVFAAADEASMQKAAALTDESTLFASNTLVIAVPAGNPADVRTIADLAEVTTILCAPEVPCGAASATLLDLEGVRVDPASLEQNVTAVLTKVATGEADAGLVYATDVIDRDDVEVIVPAAAAQVVNHYPIATLDDARNPDAAAAFVAFVLSDAGQAILADHGFGAP